MENKKPLLNPLKTDFSYQMRDEENVHFTITMPAGEITWLPLDQYEFMKRHLTDEIYHLEGDPRRDRDLEKTDIHKRIEVDVELA